MRNKKLTQWIKWQRGQSLMEYWPTIPASLIIMLSATVITSFITDSILKTKEALEPAGLECEQQVEEEEEGPTHAQLGCHEITLVGKSYNEDTDRTTATYRVRSVCDPSISHWNLGIPLELEDHLKEVSPGEKIEWGTDPTTGVTGLKFDTGYESDSGKEEEEQEPAEDEEAEETEEPKVPPGQDKDKDNDEPVETEEPEATEEPAATEEPEATEEPKVPPGQDKDNDEPVDDESEDDTKVPPGQNKNKSRVHPSDTHQAAPSTWEERDIFLTWGGYFEWEATVVAVKAGGNTYTSTISAPVAVAEPTPEEQEECEF